MNNPSDDVLATFLAHFNNDVSAATRALASYNTRRGVHLPVKNMGGQVIISAKNLQRTYRKRQREEVPALQNISFTIDKSAIVTITGASGSGKSTLLHILGGLDKPSSGTIMINKTDPTTLNDAQLAAFRNRTIGFVFQFFYLQPFLTAEENIQVPAIFAHQKTDMRRQRTKEILERMQLTHLARRYPKELSGGQIQRIAIARALINNPAILLADEPTGNLDAKNSALVMEMFQQVRKDFGTTVIIVTHDHQLASQADQVIALSKDHAR